MRPRTALSDVSSDELRSRIIIAKWSLNSTYGRFSSPADVTSMYTELSAIRRELRARGE